MQNEISQKIKSIIKSFNNLHGNTCSYIIGSSNNMLDVCRRIERSWSGSFAGWHGRMYFNDFEIPSIQEKFSVEWGNINGMPEGWREREPEEIESEIERIVGNNFSISDFEHKSKEIKNSIENVRDEIIILFSNFQFDERQEKEKQIFNQIEKFTFGKSKSYFINQSLPKTLITRDKEALIQGICLPSWLYYEGIAYEAKSVCESVEKFIKIIHRFIKRLGIKMISKSVKSQNSSDLIKTLHPQIYKKCKDLYKRDSYAEAVEKSFKIVRDRLRQLTDYETGSEAFGKGKLHIKGAAAPNVDKDFNEAVKFLTMAIDRFRNEKSHTSDAKIDNPIRAYEYLRLSSLAMNLLDKTEILNGNEK